MRWESQSIFHKDAYPKTLAIEMVESTNFLDKCIIVKLGVIDYNEAYQIQKRLHRRRLHRDISDILLLLEHPPKLTIGRSGSPDDILVSNEKLSQEGISLNVSTNLEHFTFINPCGFSNRKATSMCKLLGYDVSMEAVSERLVSHFSDVFDTSMEDCSHIA